MLAHSSLWLLYAALSSLKKILLYNLLPYEFSKSNVTCAYLTVTNRLLYSHLVNLFPVGKVPIKKEDLSRYSGKETWFILQPVDPNSEVQVKLNCGFM